MNNVTDFDKNIFYNQKYHNSILESMAKEGCIDISERISRFIGKSTDCSSENSYKGFFNRTDHGDYITNVSENALKSFEYYLDLDPLLKNNKDKKTFMSTINSIYQSDNLNEITSDLKKIYDSDNLNSQLMINKDNLPLILKDTYKKVPCRDCNLEWDLNLNTDLWDQYCNSEDESKTNKLCLPSLILIPQKRKDFFRNLFQEIVTHSICHCNKGNVDFNDKAEISSSGQNLGKAGECLYLICISEKQKGEWKNVNGKLEKPKAIIEKYQKSNLFLYCDYVIIIPVNQSEYHVLNINEGSDSKIIVNTLNINVRFKKSLLLTAIKNGKIYIEDPDLNGNDKQIFIVNNKENINHILIFNHHRYRRG